jgi:hypothetical protein
VGVSSRDSFKFQGRVLRRQAGGSQPPNFSCVFGLPLVLDVDGAACLEAWSHAGARHGRERGAAEHEVGAVGPGMVRDHHLGARRGTQLLVLALHLEVGAAADAGMV